MAARSARADLIFLVREDQIIHISAYLLPPWHGPPPFRLLTLRPPIVCVRKGKIARLLALPLDIFSKNR